MGNNLVSKGNKRVIVKHGSRIVGIINGESLTKTITAKHYLRQPPAIAFAVEAITVAQWARVTRVLVTDSDTGAVYTVTLADFMAHSFELDRGFGKQRALRLERWTKNGVPPAPPKARSAVPRAVQPTLAQEVG